MLDGILITWPSMPRATVDQSSSVFESWRKRLQRSAPMTSAALWAIFRSISSIFRSRPMIWPRSSKAWSFRSCSFTVCFLNLSPDLRRLSLPSPLRRSEDDLGANSAISTCGAPFYLARGALFSKSFQNFSSDFFHNSPHWVAKNPSNLFITRAQADEPSDDSKISSKKGTISPSLALGR